MDLVTGLAGGITWGVEVKAAMGVEPRDTRGLTRLAAACGNDFRGGIVICTGEGVWRLGDPRIHSVGCGNSGPR